jgi:hypothetical protein
VLKFVTTAPSSSTFINLQCILFFLHFVSFRANCLNGIAYTLCSEHWISAVIHSGLEVVVFLNTTEFIVKTSLAFNLDFKSLLVV